MTTNDQIRSPALTGSPWDGWFNVLNQFFSTFVQQRGQSFLRGRDVRYLSRELLVHHLRGQGVDWPVDPLNDDDIRRVARFINLHWPRRSGPDFVDFVGFILRRRLQLLPLWTKDYSTFYINDFDGQRVYQGGEYYPTTHIGVAIDDQNLIGTDLSDDALAAMLDDIAPAPLVIKFISKLIAVVVPKPIVAVAQGWDKGIDIGQATPNYTKPVIFTAQGVDYGIDVGVAAYIPGPSIDPVSRAQLTVNLSGAAESPYLFDGKGNTLGPGWLHQRNSVALNWRLDGKIEYVSAGTLRIGARPGGGASALGAYHELGATNLMRSSSDLSKILWTNTGAIDSVVSSPGIRYGSTTVRAVADTSNSVAANKMQAGNMANYPYVVSAIVNVQSGIAGLTLEWGINTSVMVRQAGVSINSVGGALVALGANTNDYGSVALGGGWYWVWFNVIPTGGSGYPFRLKFWPAWGAASTTTPDVTAQGLSWYEGFQIEAFRLRPSSMIDTASGLQTRGSDILLPSSRFLQLLAAPKGWLLLAATPMWNDAHAPDGQLLSVTFPSVSGSLAIRYDQAAGRLRTTLNATPGLAAFSSAVGSGRLHTTLAWGPGGPGYRNFVGGTKDPLGDILVPVPGTTPTTSNLVPAADAWIDVITAGTSELSDGVAAALDT